MHLFVVALDVRAGYGGHDQADEYSRQQCNGRQQQRDFCLYLHWTFLVVQLANGSVHYALPKL